MSDHFPECPLKTHNYCKEFYDPKVCAIVRKEKVCLRKQQRIVKTTHTDFHEAVKRIKQGKTL